VGEPAFFFTLYAAVTVAWRVIIGPVSDRWGRKVVIVPSMVVLIAVMLLFPLISSASGLYGLAVLYAASYGCLYPSLSALIVDVVPAHGRGSALGVFTGGFDLGIMVGSYAGGLIAQWWGLAAGFAGAGLFCLAGLVVFLLGTRALRPASPDRPA
jgi:DHA1 family bicyclomycin/chloramphenicol resistance-like MFS transporter